EAYKSRNHTLRSVMRVLPAPAMNMSEIRAQLADDLVDRLWIVVPVLCQLRADRGLHDSGEPGLELAGLRLRSEVRVPNPERRPQTGVLGDRIVHRVHPPGRLFDVRTRRSAESRSQ